MRDAAAILGAGQADLLADDPEQGRVGIHVHVVRLAVDRQARHRPSSRPSEAAPLGRDARVRDARAPRARLPARRGAARPLFRCGFGGVPSPRWRAAPPLPSARCADGRGAGKDHLAPGPALEEAGASLGAGPLRSFFLVTLPLLWPTMLAGWLFAFIVSFGELNTAIFLTGPGTTTLPIEIFSYLQFQGSQLVIAAASALQVAMIVVMVAAIERVVGIGRIVRSR
ncbi:MAG: ABC transporter permease subunit [Alphaproteobacteria bacterium]|nr:ABC transporter permease subunit [Alphaproteobacteria bacterium]